MKALAYRRPELSVASAGPSLLCGILLILLSGRSELGPRSARAQPPADSIQVRSLGPDRIETDPSRVITLRFRVENRSGVARKLEPTLDLPSGWRVLSQTPAFSLNPGESTLRLISVSVPARASPGDEPLRLQVAAAGEPSLRDEAVVTVRVSQVQEARLRTVRAPGQVSAGAPYKAIYSFTNSGNEPVQFSLRAESDRSLPVEISPKSGNVGPQETRRIRATVKTEVVPDAFEHRLRVQARLQPWDTTITEQTRVSVLPRGTAGGGFLSGPEYSGQLRLEGFGRAARQGAQVTFDASDSLSLGSSRSSLDLLLRTPQYGTARFGGRSAYRATYATSSWTIRAGDQSFQRTRLAGRGRRGLGVEVRHKEDRWQAGGYAFRTRFGEAAWQEAAYGRYVFHPRARAGANLVRSHGSFENGTLGTLQGTFVPWSGAEITLEGGLGTGERGKGAAYNATLSGDPSWGNYRARRLRISDGFPNTSGDRRRTSISTVVRPVGWLSVNGSARRSVRDRTGEESFASNAAQAGLQVGGRGKTVAWSLRASGSATRRTLRNERTLQAQGRLRVGPIGLRPGVEVGRIQIDGEGDLAFRTYRADVSASLGPQRLSGRVSVTDAPFSREFTRRSRLRATLSSQTRLGNRGTVSLRGTIRNPGGGRRSTRSLQGGASYRLPFGHTIDARARYRLRQGGQDEDLRVRLAYTVPISLPTPALPTDQATLSGRVIEGKTNAPLPNVRVRLGTARRVTGESGRFSVPVPEGTSYLQLSGLKRGRVPMIDLPLPIRPSEASTDLVIPIRESASLTVRMVLYEYPTARAAIQGKDPEPVGGVAGDVIDISDGRGSARSLTGSNGRARFSNLRPGTWSVEPAGLQVPSDKTLEKSTYEVDLTPGEVDTLTVRVLPESRPDIQFQEGGQLELGAEGPEEEGDEEPREKDPGQEELGERASIGAGLIPFQPGLGPFAGKVGAFREESNALRAAAQVRDAGYQVGFSTVKKEESTFYRVWAGQFSRRPAARESLRPLRERFPNVSVARPSPPKGYSIQTGAFSSWKSAVQGVKKALSEGRSVFSYATRQDGELFYRVWVGRQGTLPAAKQELEELARQFRATRIVRTAPPGRLAVQLGSFSERRSALRLKTRALQDGEEAYVRYEEENGKARYEVLVGGFESRAEAISRSETLSSKYEVDSFVTRTR